MSKDKDRIVMQNGTIDLIGDDGKEVVGIKPTNVYVFDNGMVACFDKNGQQIPELQGRWDEKKGAITSSSDRGCNYEFQSWKTKE
jgi:hypothetical protein